MSWPASLTQSIFLTEEFALLRSAEIPLPWVVIDTGVGVDPNDFITGAHHLRGRDLDWGLGISGGPRENPSNH